MSIGLSCVYAGSRTLTALAETGYAPKIFAYVDKSSRPLWSVVAILAFGALAYVNCVAPNAETGVKVGDTVFDWLVALSGLSTLFTWLSICLCHIRFRRAWKVQGHSVEELPFQALGGEWGSWFGVVLVIVVLIAQFYIAIWPLGGMDPDPQKVAEGFFKVYLALPVLILFYGIGYFWKRTLPQRAHEIDLDTGRKSWLTVEEMRQVRFSRLHYVYQNILCSYVRLCSSSVPRRTRCCAPARPRLPCAVYELMAVLVYLRLRRCCFGLCCTSIHTPRCYPHSWMRIITPLLAPFSQRQSQVLPHAGRKGVHTPRCWTMRELSNWRVILEDGYRCQVRDSVVVSAQIYIYVQRRLSSNLLVPLSVV